MRSLRAVTAKLLAASRSVGLKLTPVAGVGDQAVSAYGGRGFPAILVRKGSAGFELAIHGAKVLAIADHGLVEEKALARLVLTRM
jgi:hypothetical protein